MAEQEIKQNSQKQQEAGKQNPLERKDAAPGAESKEIMSKMRDSEKVQTVTRNNQISTLVNTALASGTVSTGNNNNLNRNQSGDRTTNRRPAREQKTEHKAHPADTNTEVREQMAIRGATIQRNTAAPASNRGTSARSAGTVSDLSQGTENQDLDSSLQHSGITDTVRSSLEKSATENIARSPENNPAISGDAAIKEIALNPSQDIVKLLDLVGPEAVLTFREKLQQVWVTLDVNAVKDLDVIARMPATLTGMTATELLMVESPQGIHFVAFLKNSNDFDVLATFDRRALLPDSPSRQLIEAALMSYEQMDTVFKEGGNRLESKVRELADTKGTQDQLFIQLQQLMVNEKRRRRKFRGIIDYLIDQLDQLDLEPDLEPFVPLDSDEELTGIGEGQLESELEVDEDLAYGIKPEDDDVH